MTASSRPSIVKCRLAGCGTIIEEFWMFCPTCGTAVSFDDRAQILGRKAGKADRRSGDRRADRRRLDDKRKVRLSR
jgi:hypothetical protein